MHPFQESDPARDKKVLNARFSFNDFDSTPEKFKLVVFTLKTYHMFSVRRNLKTVQASMTLNLCLWKTRVGKSYDYYDVFLFE